MPVIKQCSVPCQDVSHFVCHDDTNLNEPVVEVSQDILQLKLKIVDEESEGEGREGPDTGQRSGDKRVNNGGMVVVAVHGETSLGK